MRHSSLLKVLLSTTLIACKSPVVDSPVGASPAVNPPVGATARKLVWSDEFTEPGLPNAAKWTYEVGGDGGGNKELQYYTARRAENARVENGKLIIEARKEEYVGKRYTSARLITNGKQAWQYGRIEVVAKLSAGAHQYHSALYT